MVTQAMKDYYRILGVSITATQKQIRDAYLTKAKIYHPDVNEGNPECARQFRLVKESYDTLGDVKLRALYNSAITPSSPPIRQRRSKETIAQQSKREKIEKHVFYTCLTLSVVLALDMVVPIVREWVESIFGG